MASSVSAAAQLPAGHDAVDGGHGHVHFDEASDLMPHEHSSIQVQEAGEGRANVHVGMLQIHHKYEIRFQILKKFLPKSENVIQHEEKVPNMNCRLVSITDHDDSNALMVVELVACREKLQKESLTLRSKEDKSEKIVLTFNARVLGKGKGTPMLRDGVHLLEAFKDPDESECGSDWQGFN